MTKKRIQFILRIYKKNNIGKKYRKILRSINPPQYWILYWKISLVESHLCIVWMIQIIVF